MLSTVTDLKHTSSSMVWLSTRVIPLSLFLRMLTLPKAKLLYLFCRSYFHIPFFQLLYYIWYKILKLVLISFLSFLLCAYRYSCTQTNLLTSPLITVLNSSVLLHCYLKLWYGYGFLSFFVLSEQQIILFFSLLGLPSKMNLQLFIAAKLEGSIWKDKACSGKAEMSNVSQDVHENEARPCSLKMHVNSLSNVSHSLSNTA